MSVHSLPGSRGVPREIVVERVVRRQPLAEALKNTDTALAVVSSVLLPLGLVVIGLGWYGAAHTPFVAKQIPYAVSGGLFGIALVIGAGLLYFGSWVARSAQEQRQASSDLLAVLTDVRDQLSVVAVPAQRGQTQAGTAVATPTGTLYHRESCSVVAGRPGLREVDPATTDLAACRMCAPYDLQEDRRG